MVEDLEPSMRLWQLPVDNFCESVWTVYWCVIAMNVCEQLGNGSFAVCRLGPFKFISSLWALLTYPDRHV